MGVEEELFAIRMELKGQREAVTGIRAVSEEEQRLRKETEHTGRASEKAEKKTSRLGASFAALGTKAKWALGFLGVGGVFALERAVHESEDLALATSGLSRNFGFATNVASRWAAVMHSREVDPKALSQAFGTLSSKMVDAARKGGTSLTAFHLLGLTQEEVEHGAKNFQWGLLRVADALGEAEGGSKRAAAAKALLGKGFQTLTPLFSEGAEGLKEQLHWADEYGVTLNTTTKDGLMEMVKGQRELKVASLGLQLALTKALMPAIHGGEEELKEFIKTLNDPDLTADQKIRRIERQFLHLEDALIQVITEALPRVAEHGGELGVKLAAAFWHGFQESDLQGKLVMGAWLVHAFGGTDYLKGRMGRLGRTAGGSFGKGMLAGLVASFVLWEVFNELFDRASHQQKQAAYRFGLKTGEWIVNGMVHLVNIGIERINEMLDEANLAAFAGVDAPNIGLVGEVDWRGERPPPETYPDPTQPLTPHGTFVPSGPEIERHPSHHKGHHGDHRNPPGPHRRPVNSPGRSLPGGGQRVLELHTHLHVDGREMAEVVRHHVLADEALG
jgi:hypothetical protein